MEPAKVDVLICQFSYGGNSSVSMTLPGHCHWLASVYNKAANDDRIGRIAIKQFSDTPITMTRNAAVKTAIDDGWDVLLFLDSDNQPDCELREDPEAKPFWDTSFDFVYDRLIKGMPSVVAAPYCGSGSEENVFAFHWQNSHNKPNSPFSLKAYERAHAAIMKGIQPCGAGPTGVVLYSRSALELMDAPWFRYEWGDHTESNKCTTEDVYNFREISLLGRNLLNEEVVFMNWDSWASHYKVVEVRKPRMITTSNINKEFMSVIDRGYERDDRLIDLEAGKDLIPDGPIEEFDEDLDVYGEDALDLNDPVHDEEPESFLDTQEDGALAVAVRKRNVCGRVVTSVGFGTSEHELEQLALLTAMVCGDGSKDVRIVEIGSWVGESATAIASELQTENSSLTCVDNFQGGTQKDIQEIISEVGGSDVIADYFRKNTAHDPRIHLVESTSEELLKALVDPQHADVIFIDADHTYESAKRDIIGWQKHLAADGLLVVHDYSTSFPGVAQAVDELFADREINATILKDSTIVCVQNSDIREWLTKNEKKSL